MACQLKVMKVMKCRYVDRYVRSITVVGQVGVLIISICHPLWMYERVLISNFLLNFLLNFGGELTLICNRLKRLADEKQRVNEKKKMARPAADMDARVNAMMKGS